MHSLEAAQANFIATINDGPDTLDQSLFAGPIDRVLLGLKAHANTISHARLVALEETFPLTRQTLGEDTFNRLSREFVETPVARESDSNGIGRHFPAFLQDPEARELAVIEWSWLESYHAVDVQPMLPADLAGLDEASLLALRVAQHPSARIVAITRPLATVLEGLAGQQPFAVLAVRPDVAVRLVSLDATEAAIFHTAAQKNATLGNLLATAIEQSAETDPTGPVMQLIGAGALVKGG